MFEKAMLVVNVSLQHALVELRYLYTAIRSVSTSTDKPVGKNGTFHKASYFEFLGGGEGNWISNLRFP